MKYSLYCVALAALWGCDPNPPAEEHAHDPVVSVTLYSDKTELFVEFKPLVANTTSRFATHLTKLGDHFTPFTEGTVTVSLVQNEKGIRHTEEAPASPGIYRLALKPSTPGKGRLVFDIKTSDYTDQLVIDDVTVFESIEAALAAMPIEQPAAISFLKEQAWKVEFATEEIKPQPFHEIIRTSGEILSAPGDEVIITANANGTVRFADGRVTVGAPVQQGQSLFALAGSTAVDNIENRYKEAKVNYEKAKLDYDRAASLVKEKIVSEKDFLDAKAAYESAEIEYQTLSRNYSSGGQRVNSSLRGFIKSILVSEGQYVSAGEPLAAVSQNQTLRLKAEVSQKYFARLPAITSANFKTLYDNNVYDTRALHGRLISFGKNVNHEDHLLPVIFEIDNRGSIIPGSLVEVFLRTAALENANTVPLTALVEEQGVFYVYVQTGGERFEKRELKLAGSDGNRVHVLSGITVGERVVTKGAYQIKLASAAGSVPGHGHEH
jgi:membrane fusion protein, heavy metal efflux system